ncbi:MAG: nucleotide pyrophosphohydrolase [Acidobacteria bacterium]|nr:MAG: nucleotide pyrophosphohydrolase [Acidobacteriota bacterium]REK06110.1 MAG: nucleotide pyrophosphohydrolase [Acidobacteriota bacterium]
MPERSLQELRDQLRTFAAERDWDQFHSPKNLAMALGGEVGELLEEFQWLSEEESASPERIAEIADELADIQIYLVRLADKLKIDLVASSFEKLEKNRSKYPARMVRGSAKKYSEYER